MTKARSKFSGFLTAVQSPTASVDDPALVHGELPHHHVAPHAVAHEPSPTVDSATPEAATRADRATLDGSEAALAATPTALLAPRRGRPSGKRSDPEFDQVTAYVRRRTHRDVKIALLQEGHRREFSELVEELLARWLRDRQ